MQSSHRREGISRIKPLASAVAAAPTNIEISAQVSDGSHRGGEGSRNLLLDVIPTS